ncbi:chemotaxis protein CheX [Caulobacter sp. RHG1]|uniref:chemotaxis protein CheX n=1 Tax=Caulobacter sp. (strain RHG1) TaxID=2545762 RepID=UPI0015535365|nr:chemotaxis protein CheX [Caulobacter sp. RHG1]NQE64280.1 Chemotaxis protein CheC -- inhibitor of MCP methylation [Caulobacter sp. RHG1]
MSLHAVFLEELERDALTELVNIGVSRAASSLRKMVGEQVLLSVPSVEVVSREGAATLIRERENGELVAVRQDFEGVFSGRALLIFPQANSMALVHAVTGGALSVGEAAEMEDEALVETGNVVLNSCLATMANMLKKPLQMSLPQVMRGDGEALFSLSGQHADGGVVLFLYINFAINDRDIRGYIAMLMDLPSLQALRALIHDFIERVAGDIG